MRKLKLNVDALKVETFEAPSANGERGTVQGHAAFATLEETCYNSCGGTCRYNTCNTPWQCP